MGGGGGGGVGRKVEKQILGDLMPERMHTWAAKDVEGALVVLGERADAGGPVTSACGATLA